MTEQLWFSVNRDGSLLCLSSVADGFRQGWKIEAISKLFWNENGNKGGIKFHNQRTGNDLNVLRSEP